MEIEVASIVKQMMTAGENWEAALDAHALAPPDAGFPARLRALSNAAAEQAAAFELAIGRTKLSDLELPDDVKPADSHVALNRIVDDDGKQRQIVRFNMPFGNVGSREFGTYFIGYARTPDVIEEMLQNMFIGKPRGNDDRILDFSTAVSGSLFFVPTADFLDDPPVPGKAVSDSEAVATDAPDAADGSLGIGSLRDRGR